MILYDLIRADREYMQLFDAVEAQWKPRPLPVAVTGLCEGAAGALYVSLIHDLRDRFGVPVLMVCADEREAVRLLPFFNGAGLRAAFFGARDLNLYNIVASHETEQERIGVLFGILEGDYDVVLTTPDAAIGYTIPPERLDSASLRLDFSTVIEPSAVAEALVAAGYTRVEQVESAGQFAVRGGILDIFPPRGRFTDADREQICGAYPLRIELFGDEIDRMGIFDPETQRITENVTAAELPPARELLMDEGLRPRIRRAVAALHAIAKDTAAKASLGAELAAIDSGSELHFLDKYITLVYPERACLLDYLRRPQPDGAAGICFIRDTGGVHDRLHASSWHSDQNVLDLIENGMISPKYAEYGHEAEVFDAFCAETVTVHFDAFGGGMAGKKLGGLFGFRSKQTVSYADNFPLLCEDLTQYIAANYRILLLCENDSAVRNLMSMLAEKDIPAIAAGDGSKLDVPDLPQGRVVLMRGVFIGGYELPTPRIALLTTDPELRSGRARMPGQLKRRKAHKNAGEQIMSYADLQVGDYVVHAAYGIGQYMGIENLTVDGVSRDYINIRYAGKDKLFLPVNQLDMVSKYIGAHADDGLLKLSKFGGGEWERAKAKAKAAVKDMAKDLIALYAARMRRPGYAFPADDECQREFEEAFAYVETDCQLRAISDIKGDMQNHIPMDRLLCGDVGFGKTEVALRAAFKAILAGKQVAILVPTTILALQHYQTALSRMRAFPVRIDMLSRFRTPKQIDQSIRRLGRGETDLIIGTHRLLSQDVKFRDLGLVIIDEEQRFGVAQKEKLKQLAANVDVLTLTATPIPRTLNMAMGGLRDISILDEAPGDRLPVQTYVLEHDDMIILEALRRELRRGGQVFYLHNTIESIYAVANRLQEALPDANITVAHGKMDKETLEDIWQSLLTGETDILVSTTIIETGVDVPNANTLIVEHADHFGLSQLHQLRGRVGRSSRRAYAYFTYRKGKTLSEISTKRLEAIRDNAEFGAGFRIALRDMEIRGAGNLLGAEQHGHLDAVGYDLYLKLLNDAVLEERGEKVKPRAECTVDLSFDAYLPERYVKSSAQRMDLYRRIALIETQLDLDDLGDELIDRFGEPPRAANNLLQIALIRAMAQKAGMKKLMQRGEEVQIVPEQADIALWSELADDYAGRLRFMSGTEAYISLRLRKSEDALDTLTALFEKYLELEESAAQS
ncbi:MAG: transcription-repair coupling factor [Clostridia bacterium]|nr:transcription-repair coupling factor [Clostridia bacterium]